MLDVVINQVLSKVVHFFINTLVNFDNKNSEILTRDFQYRNKMEYVVNTSVTVHGTALARVVLLFCHKVEIVLFCSFFLVRFICVLG